MKTVAILIILLSTILALRVVIFFSQKPSYSKGEAVILEHTFWQEPKQFYASQVFYIDNIRVAVPYLYPKFTYGDKVLIQGEIEEKRVVSKQDNQVTTILNLRNPRVEIQGQSIYLIPAVAVRHKIISGFNNYLPQAQASMFLGIVLGIREGLNPSFYEQLKKTGVVHVIAASGSNVSILAGFLLGVLNLFVKRRVALFFTSLIVVFYALISGFDPPIVRASIMAMTAFSAQMIGRQNTPFIALFVSAFLMLIVSPSLVLDIGFQLSFLSTAGILYIKPIIDKILSIKYVTFLKEDFSTTVSAQVSTMPIILSIFSYYSPVSLIVNLLLLWTIPILMVLGIISSILCLVVPVLSVPFLYLALPLLLFFQKVVEFFGGFELGLRVEGFSVFITFAYYCFLLSFVLKKSKRS